MNDTTVDTQSTTDLIVAEKRNGVGYLGFNRPEKHNAISYEMWQGIAKVMADFEADDTVRAVVVSGEGGRAFSAGADISQFEKQRASTDTIEEYNVAAGLAHEQLTNISKPTIAKIVGYCIGGDWESLSAVTCVSPPTIQNLASPQPS